ncbi:MAG: hypothetical protein M1522_04775 [Actinobacteria bacterium]|jgi:hypothetical protein|nr:hypothetical protein [Actinomycetota bacterium]
MGSCDFVHYQRGADAKSAYSDAVSQALSEYGSDPYNGTISTTRGFQIVSATPMLMQAAERYAREHAGEFSKWESCGAIPVVEGEGKRSVEVMVKVPGNPSNEERWAILNAQVKEKVRLRAGEVIASIRDKQPELDRASGRFVGGPEPRYKVVTSVTKAAVETRFIVRGLPSHDTFAGGFTTQAEARAAAVGAAGRQNDSGLGRPSEMTFEIEAVRRRATGEALVSVSRALVSCTYTVVVEIAKAPTRTTVDGWLFFGMAAM